MTKRTQAAVLAVISMVLLLGTAPAAAHGRPGADAVDALLESQPRPFAIAHRGFGENLGQDPTRPVENTVSAVRAGLEAGAMVVEVDVQRTRDGRVAVYHDDVLPDHTCIATLTLAELRARLPHLATLEAVLDELRRHGRPGAVLIVELKAASPLCDPADVQDLAIAAAVARVVHRERMSDRVIFTSFSPALLLDARAVAPDVTRSLTLSALQFLTQEEIEAALHLPVTSIRKTPSLGLQWAEIGPLFRLPGYASFAQVLATAARVDARVVEVDLPLLASGGAGLIGLLHDADLAVFGYTANVAAEWLFMQGLGADGIYTNDVPLGVSLEAPAHAGVGHRSRVK